MKDLEVQFEVLFLLSMAQKAAKLALNTNQIFGVPCIILDFFVVQVIFFMMVHQMFLDGG